MSWHLLPPTGNRTLRTIGGAGRTTRGRLVPPRSRSKLRTGAWPTPRLPHRWRCEPTTRPHRRPRRRGSTDHAPSRRVPGTTCCAGRQRLHDVRHALARLAEPPRLAHLVGGTRPHPVASVQPQRHLLTDPKTAGPPPCRGRLLSGSQRERPRPALETGSPEQFPAEGVIGDPGVCVSRGAAWCRRAG
jgi:hypothetical protein